MASGLKINSNVERLNSNRYGRISYIGVGRNFIMS